MVWLVVALLMLASRPKASIDVDTWAPLRGAGVLQLPFAGAVPHPLPEPIPGIIAVIGAILVALAVRSFVSWLGRRGRDPGRR
jgi:hypothetical protein